MTWNVIAYNQEDERKKKLEKKGNANNININQGNNDRKESRGGS